MNTTDTSNNAKPAPVDAPDAIREQVADLRALVAIATAPAVLAVLDRFDGKVINRRLWDALKEAARTVDKGATIYGPGDDAKYGKILEIYRQRYTRGPDGNDYAAGQHDQAIYTADLQNREKTATGARLDAASVRAEILRVAGDWTKTADELEEQAGRFGELLAQLRALGEAAAAFCENWRPEFRHLLHADGGGELSRVARLRDATRDSFRAYY